MPQRVVCCSIGSKEELGRWNSGVAKRTFDWRPFCDKSGGVESYFSLGGVGLIERLALPHSFRVSSPDLFSCHVIMKEKVFRGDWFSLVKSYNRVLGD